MKDQFKGNQMRACGTSAKVEGISDKVVDFLIDRHFCSPELWAKFVDQFRIQDDSANGGWRGEYWGKMMRGASLVCQYRQDEKLFSILTDSVKDMLTVAENGRVSSYKAGDEFKDWDMWCRKYVLLGLEYYLDICRDEKLREDIIAFLRVCADHILEHVGPQEGKKSITKTSGIWKAINSSSILEPMVRLYRLTNDKKYFDFATYIIENGGADGINIFELAYENKLYPYQYGTPKAYELMSCFEGLIEYALLTKNEKYKTAAINFTRALAESDVTVIGCCGIMHELLDHSGVRQTAHFDGVSQETCVTVTWMKLCAKVLQLTGDAAFAEYMETSLYNAYFGAINENDCICDYIRQKYIEKLGRERVIDIPLPFDSYSPLIPGLRGQKVGGNQMLSDDTYYGCCACIGGAGIGVYLNNLMTLGADDNDKTLYVNFLFNGEQTVSIGGTNVKISMKTDYPTGGNTSITVSPDAPVSFKLKVRIPSYAEGLTVSPSGALNDGKGYTVFDKEWSKTEVVSIAFGMSVKAHLPAEWSEDTLYNIDFQNNNKIYSEKVCREEKEKHYICFTRGPIVLAADSSLGKPADSVFELDEESAKSFERIDSPERECILMCTLTDKNGDKIKLIDYSSAGKDWKTLIAAWLPTK